MEEGENEFKKKKPVLPLYIFLKIHGEYFDCIPYIDSVILNY